MKTLDEYNKEFSANWHYAQIQKHKTGVACPKCNNEMIFDNPDVVLTSYPPKKTVFCLNCHHTDYMYA